VISPVADAGGKGDNLGINVATATVAPHPVTACAGCSLQKRTCADQDPHKPGAQRIWCPHGTVYNPAMDNFVPPSREKWVALHLDLSTALHEAAVSVQSASCMWQVLLALPLIVLEQSSELDILHDLWRMFSSAKRA
jgi:hypothetical protein